MLTRALSFGFVLLNPIALCPIQPVIFEAMKKSAVAITLLAAAVCALSHAAADSNPASSKTTVSSAIPRSERKLQPLEELIRARARLTEKEVVSIAIKAAQTDRSPFEPPEVTAHMDTSRQISWSVRFRRAGAKHIMPGTDLYITVIDRTGQATAQCGFQTLSLE